MKGALSDGEIALLVKEAKRLSKRHPNALRMRSRDGFEQFDTDLEGEKHTFHLRIRRSEYDNMDFSVIVSWDEDETGREIVLRRYNGSAQPPHKNPIEGTTIQGFHTHEATHRYWKKYDKPEKFAALDGRFRNVAEALRCAVQDCNIEAEATRICQPALGDYEGGED